MKNKNDIKNNSSFKNEESSVNYSFINIMHYDTKNTLNGFFISNFPYYPMITLISFGFEFTCSIRISIAKRNSYLDWQ